MNLSSLRDHYGRPATILGAGWLIILSVIVLIDHGHWRQLSSLAKTETARSAIRAVEARVVALESEWNAQTHQPPPVTMERFAERSHALEERLTHLEQRASLSASQQEVDSLSTRVNALETVHARPVQAGNLSAPRKANIAASSAPVQPPFHVLGLEMRGGESFLAIAPPGAVSLAEMSVLHVGDVQDSWQLEALDSKSATFRFQGQPHRLELP
jgi:hypothetical protein